MQREVSARHLAAKVEECKASGVLVLKSVRAGEIGCWSSCWCEFCLKELGIWVYGGGLKMKWCGFRCGNGVVRLMLELGLTISKVFWAGRQWA